MVQYFLEHHTTKYQVQAGADCGLTPDTVISDNYDTWTAYITVAHKSIKLHRLFRLLKNLHAVELAFNDRMMRRLLGEHNCAHEAEDYVPTLLEVSDTLFNVAKKKRRISVVVPKANVIVRHPSRISVVVPKPNVIVKQYSDIRVPRF
jgi:hypothetical protein